MRTNIGHLQQAAALVAIAAAACAQAPEPATRALWDSTFLRNRPAQKKVSRVPQAVASGATDDAFVGLTVWRLRRSRPADELGVRMFVHEHVDEHDTEWTPERVPADSLLTAGQMFRLSIETARAGYLYIVDRDQYSDGSFSDPRLIFPTLRTRGGNNRVTPGAPVEFPAWDDDPPYLRLVPSPSQVAAVLTLVITPQPLANLTIRKNAPKLDPRQLAEWESKWGSQTTRLDADHTVGHALTVAEKAAATGVQPLTIHDPAPQTLYKVEAKEGHPLLVTVPLRIRK